MRVIALPAAALLFVASAGCATAQTRLDVAYSVYLTGIPVGHAAVTVDLNKSGFVAEGSARTSGLIRLFSKGRGSASVRATVQSNRVISSFFNGHLNTSRRDQKIELNVVNGFAKEFSIEPPQTHSEDRIPITNQSRTNVLDPFSAMLALVPGKGDLLSPESCKRTLPIFDGRYRFNVELSYLRTEQAATKGEGYRGPVLVCQARYIPIAGHHDSAVVRQMAENRDIFVWLAPVSDTRVLAPIKASVSTMIGTFVVEATRFQTTPR